MVPSILAVDARGEIRVARLGFVAAAGVASAQYTACSKALARAGEAFWYLATRSASPLTPGVTFKRWETERRSSNRAREEL